MSKSKMLRLSIDLTRIAELSKAGHSSVSTSEKNGKKYLNATVWLNETEDQYGNIGSVQVWDKATNSKEYVGNLKNATPNNSQPASNTQTSTPNVNKNDDLPF